MADLRDSAEGCVYGAMCGQGPVRPDQAGAHAHGRQKQVGSTSDRDQPPSPPMTLFVAQPVDAPRCERRDAAPEKGGRRDPKRHGGHAHRLARAPWRRREGAQEEEEPDEGESELGDRKGHGAATAAEKGAARGINDARRCNHRRKAACALSHGHGKSRAAPSPHPAQSQFLAAAGPNAENEGESSLQDSSDSVRLFTTVCTYDHSSTPRVYSATHAPITAHQLVMASSSAIRCSISTTI